MTTLIVNLALQLAAKAKVLIFDADLGMANVHLAFVKSISHSLADVVSGSISMDDAIVPMSDGIDLIAGGSGVEKIADINEAEALSIVQAFSALDSVMITCWSICQPGYQPRSDLFVLCAS